MIIKTFVEGPISANNYLLIHENTREAVLIDCSSPRDGFVNSVRALGVNLKYIFLTHGHFDHILGCEKFSKTFGVNVYMNEKDNRQVELANQMASYYSKMDVDAGKSISHFVNEGDKFSFGDINIEPISTPGHIEGGMCYLIDGKLFSGDTLFKDSVGRCDLEGGNFQQLLKSLYMKSL